LEIELCAKGLGTFAHNGQAHLVGTKRIGVKSPTVVPDGHEDPVRPA
jgi:hypothetical protein